MNEAGSAPRGDNGRRPDNVGSLPTPLDLEAMRIPSYHPDFGLGGDLYPDIGAKGKEAVDELPTPASKVRISS